MEFDKKIIGTLVPLTALFSSEQNAEDRGTFETGIIFLDWLKKTAQNAWQLLPLHETQLEPGSRDKRVPSPYKSYGIGLSPRYLPSSFAKKFPTENELKEFVAIHKEWIHDYALYCALADFYHTDDWRTWDEDLKKRDKKAIEEWTTQLKKEINFHIITQWRLHLSYDILREKAHESGITLIGDLPFYLTMQSPLVWAHPEVFQIQEDGTMPFVSGIPDSPSAHFGRQVWGHPLYNWELRDKTILFWEMRLQYLSTLFDLIRLDHAKAFFEYGVIDPKNSHNDSFKKGPGTVVLEDLVAFCHDNDLKIFAEDSGEHVREVRDSLQKLHIPGIKIFRFAYEEKKDKIIQGYADIVNYPENTVLYTTTHDTEPLLGYLKILSPVQKRSIAAYTQVKYSDLDKEFAIRLRNALLKSPARIVIIPIQDWLLTTERINIPGTEKLVNDPNWQFRLQMSIEQLPVSL